MHYIAYLIPIVTVLVVAIRRGDYMAENQIWYYLSYLAVLELGVGLMHFLMHKAGQTREYLGGVYQTVRHYFEWIEKRVTYETVLVNGRSVTRKKYEYIRHPEEFDVVLNTGKVLSLSRDSFYYWARVWMTPRETFATHHPNEVDGGGGESYDWDRSEQHARIVTYTGLYTNPLRHSNSIFRYTEISKKEAKEKGLYAYPKIVDRVQACVVAPFEIDRGVQRLFTYINAIAGLSRQIHIFVLIYDANEDQTSSVETAELQRAYWKGGNKNEFTLCLGIKDYTDGVMTLGWYHAFSWMEEPVMAVKLEAWLRERDTLSLIELNDWFRTNLDLWKRKEFKDFKYIHTSMRWWQLLILYTSVAAMIYGYCRWMNSKYVIVSDACKPKTENIENVDSTSTKDTIVVPEVKEEFADTTDTLPLKQESTEESIPDESTSAPTTSTATSSNTTTSNTSNPCYSCNGTGKCDYCDGTGIDKYSGETCLICEGKKRCRECNGTGKYMTQEEMCTACKGTGKCSLCKGKGSLYGDACVCNAGKCSVCGGKGKGWDSASY